MQAPKLPWLCLTESPYSPVPSALLAPALTSLPMASRALRLSRALALGPTLQRPGHSCHLHVARPQHPCGPSQSPVRRPPSPPPLPHPVPVPLSHCPNCSLLTEAPSQLLLLGSPIHGQRHWALSSYLLPPVFSPRLMKMVSPFLRLSVPLDHRVCTRLVSGSSAAPCLQLLWPLGSVLAWAPPDTTQCHHHPRPVCSQASPAASEALIRPLRPWHPTLS